MYVATLVMELRKEHTENLIFPEACKHVRNDCAHPLNETEGGEESTQLIVRLHPERCMSSIVVCETVRKDGFLQVIKKSTKSVGEG